MKNEIKIYPKINYIGNKEKISNWILSNLPIKNGTVLDLFAGSSSVSYALKKANFKVITNDVLYSSFVISKAIIENSFKKLNKNHIVKAQKLLINDEEKKRFNFLKNKLFFDNEIDDLSKLVVYSEKIKGMEKYIFQALIRRSMIRKLPYSRMNIPWDKIKELRNEEFSYLKYGRKRSYHNKSFFEHMFENLENYNNSIFDNGFKNLAYNSDCLKLLNKIKKVDLIYIDPPYPNTMNDYQSFYNFFDKMFNKNKTSLDLVSKNTFVKNFSKVIKKSASKTKYIVVSINKNKNTNEVLSKMIKILKIYGEVKIQSIPHNYQITGKTNKNTNEELTLTVEVRNEKSK